MATVPTLQIKSADEQSSVTPKSREKVITIFGKLASGIKRRIRAEIRLPSSSPSAGQKPRMNDVVIDTSVLLTILKSEAIDQEACEVVTRGVVSAVNVAEFYSKLASAEGRLLPPVHALLSTLRRMEVFTPKQAQTAGLLRTATKHAGFSLGDRACLTLALELGVPAYTVDRSWLRVDVGCLIYCLR